MPTVLESCHHRHYSTETTTTVTIATTNPADGYQFTTRFRKFPLDRSYDFRHVSRAHRLSSVLLLLSVLFFTYRGITVAPPSGRTPELSCENRLDDRLFVHFVQLGSISGQTQSIGIKFPIVTLITDVLVSSTHSHDLSSVLQSLVYSNRFERKQINIYAKTIRAVTQNRLRNNVDNSIKLQRTIMVD